MDWLTAPEMALGRMLFQRALAAVYLIAFVAAANQFRPLLGERGLLPAPRFLERVPFRASPSLFHLHYSDRLLTAVTWTGAALAALAVAGVPDTWPTVAVMALWAALWVLYLSIVNVGQTFYSFGWESLLLETGFLAIFLGPARVAPPLLVMWLLRWLLFRVEFGAGLIKLRGDPCWRDLTCLEYHHETQPMPNPLSRLFHLLPRWMHRAEVAGNHVAQLVAPFGLFAPQPVATVAALVIVATQAWLVTSGNFAFLNALTIVLALSAVDGAVIEAVLPLEAPAMVGMAAWHHGLVIALTAGMAVLSWWPVRNMASRRQRMNASFNRLHLCNTYGAFGSVTKERYEVVVEGTRDPLPGPGSEWREYEFKGKPGDPTRRPPQVAPYHLRLDWLMWFAALSPAYARGWFEPFLRRLLEGDRPTLRLLREQPFPDGPPAVVRARLYRYRFTTRSQRRELGAVWQRTLVGEFTPPVTLSAEGRLTTVFDEGAGRTPPR